MVELHNIIMLSHLVACPIIFILFYDRGWQGVVFIVIKNNTFLVLLAVWVNFSKILDKCRSGLY